MDKVKITVNKREKTGKEQAKKLRKNGFIPAVVYSEKMNIPLSVPVINLKALRSIHYSESAIINMEIVDEEKKSKVMSVLIKDIQFNPMGEDDVLHIDFLKVSLKEKIKVHVPIVLKGEPSVVKEGEGVLEQVLRELEIEALPLDIPEKIEVDISELSIGHSLHVEGLKIDDKLKVTTDLKATVATVVAKKEEEVEVEAEAEEVLAEEGAPTEPEVIKEKKEGAESEKETKPKGDESAKKEDKK